MDFGGRAANLWCRWVGEGLAAPGPDKSADPGVGPAKRSASAERSSTTCARKRCAYSASEIKKIISQMP